MKIALIDPVGAKMGMNHYDDGLLGELVKKNVKAYLFSNYQSPVEGLVSKVVFNNINTSVRGAIVNNLAGIFRTFFFCRRNKVDYLVFHIFKGGLFDLFSLLITRFFHLKIVLIVHDIGSIDTDTIKFIKKIVLKYFHHIMVVHNKYSLERLEEFTGEKSQNTFVVPHGNFLHSINKTFPLYEAVNYLGLDPQKKYLLFFGQIKKTKGLDVLLESLQYCKSDFKLIIAGKLRMDNFNYYNDLINKYLVRDKIVLRIKYHTDDEAAMLFTLCDAVVLPYKIIYQSGVALTAMSYGKTVIASDLEPFKEIIRHNHTGLLFSRDNPLDLATQIDKVFTREVNINQIGLSACNYVKNYFSWNEIASSYLKILS